MLTASDEEPPVSDVLRISRVAGTFKESSPALTVPDPTSFRPLPAIPALPRPSRPAQFAHPPLPRDQALVKHSRPSTLSVLESMSLRAVILFSMVCQIARG